MKILLTGGTGFIGSHTAVELISSGYDVVLADDLSNSSARIVDNIRMITGVQPPFYQGDVKDRSFVNRIFDEHEIDGVIHFAGFKAVGESVADPLSYYRNNIGTTLTLLDVMKAHKCSCFVFSSSACVYSEKNTVPFAEDAMLESSNPYGRTKLISEQLLQDYASSCGDFSAVILRYFNPAGAHPSGMLGETPNGRPDNLMPYITQVAFGKLDHLNIFGNDYPTEDGTGIRDYLHICDLAKGHIKALEYAFSHKGTEIFNLGSGKGYSVMEIVRAFEAANGLEIPYEFADRRPGDISVSYADTSKAEKLLGWKAEKGIDDMCRDAWRWQQSIWCREIAFAAKNSDDR